MCVNQKCMSVESLRAQVNKCPQDCNGHGVCNSLGHCHCQDGFSPPFCDYPGPGGSTDSGPASDPNARKDFIMAMYIVFLGIIPLIALVGFLMYYMKHNVNFKWQKTGPSAYVFRCLNCIEHVINVACRGGGKKEPTVPTLSHRIDKRYTSRNINLDIQQTGLVSTTNENLLNVNSQHNLLDIIPPPKRRMSLKSIKGLKVDIRLKHKINKHVESPKTSETVCSYSPDDFPTVSVKTLCRQYDKNGGGSSSAC